MRKLLLKFLGNSIYNPEPIDVQKMQDWLWKSYKEEGFKHYYTMRKKYLVNLQLAKMSEEERAEGRGRLLELQGLSANINSEAKKKKLEAKKG